MRWEDERYVRWYTRNTPEWSVMEWMSRGLFGLIMREVDRAGILELGKLGLSAVAVAVRAPWDEIEGPLAKLLADGCVVFREELRILLIPNFIDAQEAPASDKARQRAARERARDVARAKSLFVTPESRNVTAPSRNVTESHAGALNGHSEPSEPSVPSVLSRSDARVNPDKAAILARVAAHRIFDGLAHGRIAEAALSLMLAKGTRLEWILAAIDECAAAIPDGLTAEARQGKLATFVRHARAPRIADSADNGQPTDTADPLDEHEKEKRRLSKTNGPPPTAEQIAAMRALIANGGRHE